MKLEERAFRIFDNERPRVLLLGNGLCRAFGGMSWDKLLDEIKDKDSFPLQSDRYLMPMPLKAEMLTNNTLASSMKKIVRESQTEKYLSWKNFTSTNEVMRIFIQDMIIDRFDYVLTTNYSYEIEAGLLNAEAVTPDQITKLMNYTEVDNAQTHFLINTFNIVGETPIWHVHGEARKPDSMVIGNYYYGKLLKRCVERVDGSNKAAGRGKLYKKNMKRKRSQKIGSWIDAFILGDVYIVGLGLDFSEIDLWWLLEYKRNNRDISGKTVFYDPIKIHNNRCPIGVKMNCDYDNSFISEIECRNLLLEKVYGVTIKDLGYSIYRSEDYKDFYRNVLADMDNFF